MNLGEDPFSRFPIGLFFGWVWCSQGRHVGGRSIDRTAVGAVRVEEVDLPIAFHFAELFGCVPVAWLPLPSLFFRVEGRGDPLGHAIHFFTVLTAQPAS